MGIALRFEHPVPRHGDLPANRVFLSLSPAGLTVRNLCPGGYLHTTHAYHSCHSDCRPGHTHGDPSDSTHDTHSKPTRNRPLLLRT